MKRVHQKSIALLIALTSFLCSAQAQVAVRDSGEIVMTEDELQSLLTKIAETRRTQLKAKERNQLLNQLQYPGAIVNDPIGGRDYSGNTVLLRRLDELNNKLDLLLASRPVVRSNDNLSSVTTSATPNPAAASDLQQQVDALKEELRVVSRLANINGSGSTKYSQDIAALNERIADLTKQLERQRRESYRQPADNGNNRSTTAPSLKEVYMPDNQVWLNETAGLKTQIEGLNQEVRLLRNGSHSQPEDTRKIDSLSNLIDMLMTKLDSQATAVNEKPDGKHIIYFDNNQYVIKKDNNKALEDLVEVVKKNEAGTTLVIRGFSSNTGNARYNYKLSFERAEAVKKWLIQRGVNSRNIVVYPHGIDFDANDKEARRVEVSVEGY